MARDNRFERIPVGHSESSELRRAYKTSGTEAVSFKNVLKAREDAELTQHEAALRMGTTQSAVARLESNLNLGIIPSHRSLTRYAKALRKRIIVNFV